jgi:hypothetical protein
MKNFLGIVVCSFAFLGLSYGADPATLEKAPLPEGQLLNRAPSFSEWTISYKYPKDTEEKDAVFSPVDLGGMAPKPRRVTVTKTGKVVHEVTVDVLGGKMEKWSDGKRQVIELPGAGATSHIIETMGGPFAILGTNYNAGDFQGLDWIKAENYKGVYGKTYIVFERENPHETAYVDLKTRLPVQVVGEYDRRRYKFSETPPTQQTMADSFQKTLDKQDQDTKALSRQEARP